ncbi:MAG: hypothetical protein Terrestrivirus3_110 [Terrestrivirus sp.]|uniref:C3H1-type domain-containing protein n=1 Tax=Terrestrivirus sp. TaxID=2487775 RepID=A0A3G4ZPF8_9VIRU|nr:MAG: hypothetical protein Terrestrivirus3_110 [Terrestrivirus sp.]
MNKIDNWITVTGRRNNKKKKRFDDDTIHQRGEKITIKHSEDDTSRDDTDPQEKETNNLSDFDTANNIHFRDNIENNNRGNHNNYRDDTFIKKIFMKDNKKYSSDKYDKYDKYDKFDKYDKIDKESLKKIMCNNVLIYGKCSYGDKCLYAHNLDEQNVDYNRRLAYNILMNKNIDVDDVLDDEMYKTFLQLTKVCDVCAKNKCPGGYNCKFGVFDKRYQVCFEDLKDGICYNISCNKIHLTNKGIKPMNYVSPPVSPPRSLSPSILADVDRMNNSSKKIIWPEIKINKLNKMNNDDSKLSQKEIFMANLINSQNGDNIDFFVKMSKFRFDSINNKNINNNENRDDDSCSSDSSIRAYLDNDSDSDDCSRSIFD